MTNVDRSVAVIEAYLERLFIAADGAQLRVEDRKKAVEVAAMLDEASRALARVGREADVTLVDAAAGKTYVGLLVAKLVLEPRARPARVVVIEREAARIEAARRACEVLGLAPKVTLDWRVTDVTNPDAWPLDPTLVTALHACGPASDAIIDRAVASRARHLLLVPCCTGRAVLAAAPAEAALVALGFPRHAPVRRRFVQAFVDAERTLRLEAAGYETEVVELVGATVTPHNLVWRARRVGESTRMARAARERERLLAPRLTL